ncbi:MAG TPA: ChuX/HutX family heme-like substrate-binding protein [Burkholderiaceae bacterium]|nr:ChuX/HutX family heme-like substrate-binding protein [Burkholderiaceae bacterium]
MGDMNSDHLIPSATRHDPRVVLDAWEALRAAHPHVHGPEAAAMLGVPEAALVASKVGQGATVGLRPSLRAALSSCAAWGKSLVALRNEAGVMLNVLDEVTLADAGAGLVKLVGRAHELLLADTAIASLFLLEDNDSHGHTLSLNWFDAGGDVIGRVFLMSKAGRERALPEIVSLALAQQSRTLEFDPAAARPDLLRLAPRTEPRASSQPRPAPARFAADAILALADLPSVSVTMEGRGGAGHYLGAVTRTSQTGPAVHATSSEIKLHLRPAAFVAACLSTSEGGDPCARLVDGQGGALTLSAPRVPGSSWDALIAKELP